MTLVFGLYRGSGKVGIWKSDTLAKLNNYKGQISNKVTTITKEHKFFTDNVTCPTCTQPIEESFRLNKIKDVQSKSKRVAVWLSRTRTNNKKRTRKGTSIYHTIKGDY